METGEKKEEMQAPSPLMHGIADVLKFEDPNKKTTLTHNVELNGVVCMRLSVWLLRPDQTRAQVGLNQCRAHAPFSSFWGKGFYSFSHLCLFFLYILANKMY